MATMVKMHRQKDEILEETYRRISDAEESRSIEFQAALKIQAWFRATRVRKYLQYLNDCAILIQKRWRGYTGRKHVRLSLKDHVFVMKLNKYNAMATKIQKVWRGFHTRKYVSNFYSRKKYLEGLMVKNEIIRNELEEYAEQQEQMKEIKQDREAKKKLDEWAQKNHFLLSTVVKPGIYNSPFVQYPDEKEYHLRNAKPQQQSVPNKGTIYDPAWKRYDLPHLEPLPPVQPKPQGPFRSLTNVQRQRYKIFQPSLRVATNFYSLEEAREAMKREEWEERIHDNVFLPFTRKSYPHEPLLHTNSKYGHLQYGTEYFRHEYPDQYTTEKNFQSVVPPIPIFEKLNDTYSQGQC